MVPRLRLLAALAVTGGALLAPAPGAEARTPCPGESAAPTPQNGALVSDAVVCLTNQVRAFHGLPALRRDTRLDAAARLHSQDMEDRDFFGHTNPDGLNPSARAQAQGYTLGAGENIAKGYRSAVAVMAGWTSSTGHCQNLLGAARDIGVGTTPGGPTFTMVLGDYSGRVPSGPRDGCPYTLDLAALDAPGTAQPEPAAPGAPAAPVAVSPGALSMTGVKLRAARIRAGRKATVRVTLSAAATVSVKVLRRVDGRRAGGRCVRAARSGRRCTAWRASGSARSFPAAAGTTRLQLTTKGMRRGRYRLVVGAADGTGRTARPRTVNLSLR